MQFNYAKITYASTLLSPTGYTNHAVAEHALLAKTVSYWRKNKFAFIDVETIEFEEKQFIYGKLVKWGDVEVGRVNIETHKSDPILLEDKIIAESTFVIDFSENYLLYTEATNHIHSDGFIDRFNDLVKQGAIDINYEMSAQPITEIYTFYEELEKMAEITEIKLTIFPTNPFPHKVIETMDAKLNEENLSKKTTKFVGKPGGIKLSEEIKNTSVYADIGYGYASAKGRDKNGKPIYIYSKKTKKQKKTPTIDNDGLEPKSIVSGIKKWLFGDKKK